jgi:putative oxidoreductase
MDALYLIGRILFVGIFIMSAIGHLTKADAMAPYAASKGVPAAKASVILTGLMLLAGGLSILLGLYMEIGAGLLFLFLLPTAFIMHNFWTIQEPQQRQLDQAMFEKDLSMAGAALVFYWLVQTHGYGPFTLGEPM